MAYGERQGQAQPRLYSATEMGVRYFCWSILLLLIWSLITLVIAGIGLYAISNVPVSILAGLLTAVCGALILGIVLIIVGIIQFNHGKNEFPGHHPRNVILGTLFFILALAMFIGGIVLLPVLGSSAAIIIPMILMLLPIFLGLMYVLMIIDVSRPGDRTLLYGGLIMFILLGIVIVSGFVAIENLPPNYGHPNLFYAISYSAAIFLAFVGPILFFIAYWRTKKALEEGIIAAERGVEAHGETQANP